METMIDNRINKKDRERLGISMDDVKALDKKIKQEENPDVEPATITLDNYAKDWTHVQNKNPNMVYAWGMKSRTEEMMNFTMKGYAPARGDEKIFSNPMIASADCGPGKTKEIGDRILMCCPKHLVQAREQARVESQVSPRESAKRDSARINRENPGSVVKIVGDNEQL